MSRRLAFTMAAMLVAYAVFTENGRSDVEWTLYLLSIGLLTLAFWLSAKSDDGSATETWIVAASVLLPTYVAVQLVPLPVSLLSVLSPSRAALVEAVGTVMPAPRFAPISVSPSLTLWYYVQLLACTLFFFLVRELVRTRSERGLVTLAVPLVMVATIEAIIALVQKAAGVEIVGTYRSRDHLAGLLEMALPLAAGSAFALIPEYDGRPWYGRERILGTAALLVGAGVMFAGFIASGSKMGLIAGLAGLFVTGVMALSSQLHGVKKWQIVVGLAMVSLAAFVAMPSDDVVITLGRIVSRVNGADGGRWPIWNDAWQLFKAYPLTGSGFGTFGTAFFKYQTALVDFDFGYAHNDYVQLLTELGVAGFAIVAVVALTVLTRAVRAAVTAEDMSARLLGIGCVGALVSIAVHSVADFNLYVPANPLVLAWVAGIAAGLPVPEADAPARRHAWLRPAGVVLASALIVCASVSVVRAVGNQNPEAAAQPASVASARAALKADQAAPYRWSDLAEAMLQAGQTAPAMRAVEASLTLGPNVPSTLWRAADAYERLGKRQHALLLMATVLARSTSSDEIVFDWYQANQIPITEILGHGLPPARRAWLAYLRWLIHEGDLASATEVWDAMSGGAYADERMARDYVNFLHDRHADERAARSWMAYQGDHRDGYLDSTQVFNGGFESDPSGTIFDWHVESFDEDVDAELDSTVARTGARSLRLAFNGRNNVGYSYTFQTCFVTPGTYRFQAFVRTKALTTNEGVRFRIVGDGINVTTAQVVGTTTGWERVEQLVHVPPANPLATIQIVREKSIKFDSHIAGTAWIDDVSLSRVE